MRHWHRSVVQLATPELEEYLQAEINRLWPEDQHSFHIEVTGAQNTTRVEVRVWAPEGVEITKSARPADFFASSAKSPTVAAVLRAVESAVAEASGQKQSS